MNIWPKAEVVNGIKVWTRKSMIGCGDGLRHCISKNACGTGLCLPECRKDGELVFFTRRNKFIVGVDKIKAKSLSPRQTKGK